MTVRNSYFNSTKLSHLFSEEGHQNRVLNVDDAVHEEAIHLFALGSNAPVVDSTLGDLLKAEKDRDYYQQEAEAAKAGKDEDRLRFTSTLNIIFAGIEMVTGVEIPEEVKRNPKLYNKLFVDHFDAEERGEITEETSLENQIENINRNLPHLKEKMRVAIATEIDTQLDSMFGTVRDDAIKRLEEIRATKEIDYIEEVQIIPEPSSEVYPSTHISERETVIQIYDLNPESDTYDFEVVYAAALQDFQHKASRKMFSQRDNWHFDEKVVGDNKFYDRRKVQAFARGEEETIALAEGGTIKVTKHYSVPLEFEFNEQGEVEYLGGHPYDRYNILTVAAIFPEGGVYTAKEGAMLYEANYGINMTTKIRGNIHSGAQLHVFDLMLRGDSVATRLYLDDQLYLLAERSAKGKKKE